MCQNRKGTKGTEEDCHTKNVIGEESEILLLLFEPRRAGKVPRFGGRREVVVSLMRGHVDAYGARWEEAVGQYRESAG